MISMRLGAPLATSFGAAAQPLGRHRLRTAAAIADQGLVSAVSFLNTLVVGRICGMEELGSYWLGFTIVVLGSSVLGSLVSTPYAVYVHHLSPTERAQRTTLVLVLCVTMAAAIAISLGAVSWIVMKWRPGAPLGPVLACVAGASPFVLLRDALRRLAFAHLQFIKTALLDAGIAGLQVTGLWWLANAGRLTAATAHLSLGAGCALVVVIWLAAEMRRAGRIGWRDVTSGAATHWTVGRWVLAEETFGVMQGYGVHWLLAAKLGAAATGLYAACMSVVLLSNPLFLAFCNVLTPRLSLAFAAGGAEELRRAVSSWSRRCGVAMGVFAVAAVLLGETLLTLLYDGRIAGWTAVAVLTVLSAGRVASGLSISPIAGLRALGHARHGFVAAGLGAAATLVLTGASWSVLGAALAFLAGKATTCLWAKAAFDRSLPRGDVWGGRLSGAAIEASQC